MRFWILALAAAGLLAQEQPTIRVTTRLVEVNVVVRSGGKPVDDLTKDDFVLLDKGQPVPIASFSKVSSKQAAATGSSLPPGVYSNQSTRSGEAPSTITVVLFDGLNTSITDQFFARQQIIKFLDKLRPQDRVAVYVLGTQVRILHDFTSDFEQLRRSLAKFRGENLAVADAANPEIAATGGTDLDRFLNDANGRIADQYNIQRVRTTLDAMEGIARHLSGIPGRKNLIWVSSSFPLVIGFNPDTFGDPARENRVFSPEIQRAARALNQASIAVYPVDARGLMVAPGFGAAQGGSGRFRGGIPPGMSMAPGRGEIDSMNMIAEQTGGKAFYNTNDISGAIRQAMDDSEVTYSLGFYPKELDGKYHDLKVQISRKGLQIRHRKGYIASDEPNAPQNRELEIRRALAQPLDAGDIALVGSVTPDAPEPGKWLVKFGVEAGRITIRKKLPDGLWVGQFDIVIAQRDASGKVLATLTDVASLSMNDEQLGRLRERVEKEGMLLSRAIQPVPECTQLRVVIYDRPSQRLGSLRIPAPKSAPAKPNK